MEYSVEQITTVADCDALLTIAAKERRDLDYKKNQENHSYENVTNGSAGVEADLAANISKLTGNQAIIPTLPEGSETRKKLEMENAKYTYKIAVLTARREKYGALGLIQKQYSLFSIDKEIAENDALVIAINKRKSEL